MRILGVEFGTWSLKAVEIESRFRRLDILDFYELRLPLQVHDPLETYRGLVSQLVARLPTIPEKVVTSLPSAQTALRSLQLPIKQRKAVERMYRFELEEMVPFKLDECVLEHQVYLQKTGAFVFAGVAPEKYVRATIDWLKEAGLDPDWMTFDGLGVINRYLNSREAPVKGEPDPPPELLLDIGHTKTNVAILHANRVELFRSISWGGAHITHALALTLGISLEEAEQLKLTELRVDAPLQGAEDSSEALATGLQSFAPFLADLNHTLVSYRTRFGKEVSRASICGGTAKLWGIEAFLTAGLGFPVTAFAPFRGITLREELRGIEEVRFGETLGRALVYTRKGGLTFNFRKDSLAKENSLKEVTEFLTNPVVIRVGRALAVLIGMLLLHVHIAQRFAEYDETQASNEVKRVFQETFRNAPKNLRTSLTTDAKALDKYIEQKNVELAAKVKLLSKERTPMLKHLLLFSEAFPTATKVDVNQLTVDDQTFSLEGVLYEGTLTEVDARLKKVALFSGVTVSNEGQRFSIKGQVRNN